MRMEKRKGKKREKESRIQLLLCLLLTKKREKKEKEKKKVEKKDKKKEKWRMTSEKEIKFDLSRYSGSRHFDLSRYISNVFLVFIAITQIFRVLSDENITQKHSQTKVFL